MIRGDIDYSSEFTIIPLLSRKRRSHSNDNFEVVITACPHWRLRLQPHWRILLMIWWRESNWEHCSLLLYLIIWLYRVAAPAKRDLVLWHLLLNKTVLLFYPWLKHLRYEILLLLLELWRQSSYRPFICIARVVIVCGGAALKSHALRCTVASKLLLDLLLMYLVMLRRATTVDLNLKATVSPRLLLQLLLLPLAWWIHIIAFLNLSLILYSLIQI